MKTIAAIINARVDSTRVFHKMVRDFCGTTLLDIALSKLDNLNIGKRYLAACEPQILDIAKKYKNISIIEREKDSVLKGKRNQRLTFDHYKHVDASHLFMINPCFPFANNETYEKSIDFFMQSDFKTMTSIKKRDNTFIDSDFNCINSGSDVSTQGQKTIYEMAHMFHVFDLKQFLNDNKFWDYSKHNPYYYILENSIELLDIDEELDFNICEALYKNGYR